MESLVERPVGWACWNCGRVWMLRNTGVYTLEVASDIICDCRQPGSRQTLHAIQQKWAEAMHGM